MKFKLQGKTIDVIDSWEKLNFEQYLRVLKVKNDMAELLSIITGIEYETIRTAKIQGLEALLYCAQFMNKTPVVPDKVERVGKYKLPANFDVQFESLAQFEDMRKALEKAQTLDVHGFTAAYAEYVAIYLQKVRDKDYDPVKAEEMVPDVLKMPALEVLAAGSFFYVKLTALLNGTPSNSRNTPPDRKKRTGTPSKKPSARTLRLTKSRGR